MPPPSLNRNGGGLLKKSTKITNYEKDSNTTNKKRLSRYFI